MLIIQYQFKTINIIKRLIFFLAILLLFTGCEKEDERTYFKAEGVGYVYNEQTKEPAKNVRVTVRSNFKSREWATTPAIDEDFYTDNTGFFKIRFLKRTQKENVVGITVYAYDDINQLNSKLYSFTVDKIREINILKLDTLWIR